MAPECRLRYGCRKRLRRRRDRGLLYYPSQKVGHCVDVVVVGAVWKGNNLIDRVLRIFFSFFNAYFPRLDDMRARSQTLLLRAAGGDQYDAGRCQFAQSFDQIRAPCRIFDKYR